MASSFLPFGIARLFANVRSAAQLDRESIAAFRIAAGCVLVADALLRSRDFWLFFSAEGIFPLNTLQAYLEPGCWSLNFLNEGLWWQGTMLAAEAAAGLSLIAGYFSSVSCFVAWIVWTSILRRTEPAANAGDYWMACLLYWGMFLPLGDMFSIDSLPRKKRKPQRLASRRRRSSPKYLLCIYMRASANYMATGSMALQLDMSCLFTITEHGWVNFLIHPE